MQTDQEHDIHSSVNTLIYENMLFIWKKDLKMKVELNTQVFYDRLPYIFKNVTLY